MQTYDYRPKAGMMALAIAFFGACAVFGFFDASSDHRALILDGLYLAPDQATLFRWGLTIASVVFVVLGLLGLVQAMIGDQRLRLGDETIEMPRSAFGSGTVTIRFADIVALELMTVRRQRFLRLKTAKRTFTIAEGKLNRKTFETVMRLVAEGRARARNASGAGPSTHL